MTAVRTSSIVGATVVLLFGAAPLAAKGAGGTTRGYTITVVGLSASAWGLALDQNGDICGALDTEPSGGVFIATAQGTQIQTIGNLVGGSGATCVAINNGHATGYAFDASYNEDAFTVSGESLSALASLPGSYQSMGVAVNASGQIAGVASGSSGTTNYQHAVVWTAGRVADFGVLSGGSASSASAINSSGQITGNSYYSSAAPYSYHAVISQGTTLFDLGTLGGPSSAGTAINDAGQVAGWADTAAGNGHAFVTVLGKMKDLGTLGGNNSVALAINQSGQVAGWADVTGTSVWHAFVTKAGRMVSVHPPAFTTSVANAINDAGAAVGHAVNGSVTHAILYNGTRTVDLNSVLSRALAAEYVLQNALAINDAGQILVQGQALVGAESVTFLLTPTT